ncbi:MAG: hypothetical protein KDH96_02375 [Candidatus Riesia sp.]|nr:hypothetical protein [Candidatus Riesia sp.]
MFIPNFIASEDPCVLPQFTETRSRNVTSFGLFFRSKQPGDTSELKVACRLFGITNDTNNNDVSVYTFKVKFFENNTWSPEQSFIQKKNTLNNTIVESCINNIKTFIGDSIHIESPIKNFDLQDNGIEPTEVEEFNITLVNGTSGPTDRSLIENIRTGPKYTMICITSTEDIHGNNITPIQKIRFWNGTNWQPFEE